MDTKTSAEKRQMLREYYLERLVSKHSELLAWRARIGGFDGASPEADLPDSSIEELRSYAHKIKGAAGSFGFPEIGDAAAVLEKADSDELGGRLQALLERVEAALSAGTAPPTEPMPGTVSEK